ncbi:EcsC family protein [Nakamurella endophytica]|uniref:EcsC family protein n=1 Tax=Nakamurella endophytica TaxID=1748367 RepID=A0A917SJL0_9ACTN|nr:EcsC family protein [Nakamurella endophytica]GGL85596.1 hypothetical protein GCM10011594_01560 [Nakamurella endophytica]
MGITGALGGELARRAAPKITGRGVRLILERAIDGIGPLPGAAESADAALMRAGGVRDAAVDALIDQHVRLAAAQGFATNIGGLLTMAVTMPANIAAVAVIQCHLAAGVVHLLGYNLQRPAVRDAILMCLLDDDARKSLGKDVGRRLTPTDLLSSREDPALKEAIATAVTGQLIAAAGGKRMATFVARRIPLLGGAIGGFGDAMATRRIGRDTAALPRNIVDAAQPAISEGLR